MWLEVQEVGRAEVERYIVIVSVVNTIIITITITVPNVLSDRFTSSSQSPLKAASRSSQREGKCPLPTHQ